MTDVERMRQLWLDIPSSNCRGMCQEACSAIGMSQLERKLLSEHMPIPFPGVNKMAADLLNRDPGTYHCPLLVNGRCQAYDDRPTICRIYGSEETIRCEWGCEPDEGYLSHAEGQRILGESMDIGGGPAR